MHSVLKPAYSELPLAGLVAFTLQYSTKHYSEANILHYSHKVNVNALVYRWEPICFPVPKPVTKQPQQVRCTPVQLRAPFITWLQYYALIGSWKTSYFRTAHVICIFDNSRFLRFGIVQFSLFWANVALKNIAYSCFYPLFSTVLTVTYCFDIADEVCLWLSVCVVMSSRYQIVVQGEASETDSDDEVYITSMPAPQTATAGTKVVM